MAIKALALLPSHVRLRMIGEGSGLEACRRLAQSAGVDNRIEWTGSLPHEEALRRLADCAVLLSPHVHTLDGEFFGSPTKLFEYMALGRPIVASRLAQIAEVLEDGRTARLVAPGNPSELANGILSVLALPDRGEAMACAAREDAKLKHRWEHRAQAILLTVGARSE